jgi:cell division septation protein DedD
MSATPELPLLLHRFADNRGSRQPFTSPPKASQPRDHETESSTATARIAELEGLQAELAEQVPKLEGVVNDLQDQLDAEKAAAIAADCGLSE